MAEQRQVERDDLEAMLAVLAAECDNHEHGLFGPDSWSWRVGREFVNFVGAGRAALLQLAHPWVATAIAQHSSASKDPLGRFNRTFVALYDMMFGSLDTCLASARRVHRLHATITGRLDVAAGAWSVDTEYAANIEEALMWVHATLIDTSFEVYDLCVEERPLRDKAAHYQESRRFGRLFGLTDRVMPHDYAAFKQYWATMLASGNLRATPSALAMVPQLLAPTSGVIGPLWRVNKAVTSWLLPPTIRAEFGLPLRRLDALVARTALRAMRRGLPNLPPRLRYVAAWHDAQRRIAGKTGPDVLAGALWRRLTASLLGQAPARP